MIHLDYRDSRPIYEQVKDGLRHLVVTGVMVPGDKLPSVRTLATQLAINPNTIQRAYGELETEVAEKVKPMLEELKNLGMSREERLARWEGGNNDA